MELSIIIPHAPRTKKNHGQIVMIKGFPKMLPARPWRAWCKAVLRDLGAQLEAARAAGVLPLVHRVNCQALFYRDRASGDACGYYQGLADVLQAAQVVVDDVQIASWDGSRLLKDARRPRTEVTLTRAA